MGATNSAMSMWGMDRLGSAEGLPIAFNNLMVRSLIRYC